MDVGFARTVAGIVAVVDLLVCSLAKAKQEKSKAGQIRVLQCSE